MSELAFEHEGSGDPILFIHGLGGTANVFRPQATVLAQFFSCYRFDLPGAGRSPSNGAATIDELVDAVSRLLKKLTVDKPAHVIGHSMGTVIAQHLALKSPGKVRSLSLVGPIHAPAEAGRASLRERATSVRTDGMRSTADKLVLAGTSAETRAARPEVAAFIRELLMGQDPEGYARHCEALADSTAADVAQIAIPALLMTGDEDRTSPPPVAAALATTFTNAQFELIPRAGHWLTLEQPHKVTHALFSFLLGAAAR
jgi:3-oxoadipate enol-lactonase